MDEKVLFKSYLTLFAEAEFPLTLTYEIERPESFSDDPLPGSLAELFIAEDDEDGDEYVEYVPVVQFRINKNYLACIVWKATLGSYEFLLIVYDNEGNIQETDSVAGSYYGAKPMLFKIAEFTSPVRANVVEANFETLEKATQPTSARKYIINISDAGEINYSLVGNM